MGLRIFMGFLLSLSGVAIRYLINVFSSACNCAIITIKYKN